MNLHDLRLLLDFHYYKLMSSQAARSPFGHMLQHVVNHGTYHRGQVN